MQVIKENSGANSPTHKETICFLNLNSQKKLVSKYNHRYFSLINFQNSVKGYLNSTRNKIQLISLNDIIKFKIDYNDRSWR